MVAKTKHQKPAPRKGLRARSRATAVKSPRLQVPRAGSKIKNHSPRPEKISPQAELPPVPQTPLPELDQAIVIAKAEAERAALPVERERSSYDGDTAIKLYLREIGQVKLLTPQEEIDLSAKIKKGDKVQVIAGADKGKKGTVLEVSPTAMKIKVEGVKVQTHYDKKDGLLKKEGFIDFSNVKLVEAKAKAAKTEKKATKKASAKAK